MGELIVDNLRFLIEKALKHFDFIIELFKLLGETVRRLPLCLLLLLLTSPIFLVELACQEVFKRELVVLEILNLLAC